MNMSVYNFIVLVSVLSLCQGRPWYRNFFPNGHHVPNPCTVDEADVWAKVGHAKPYWWKLNATKDKDGFGKDFLAAKKNSTTDGTGDDGIWGKLCMLDSDGDNITNGEELGDKDCTWKKSINGTNSPGEKPALKLYHPGIPENRDGTLTAINREKYCKP